MKYRKKKQKQQSVQKTYVTRYRTYKDYIYVDCRVSSIVYV